MKKKIKTKEKFYVFSLLTIYHIHKFHALVHHTTDLDIVRMRNCHIHNICPKSLLRDWPVCHIHKHHIHIVHGHCNRLMLYYLVGSHGHVPIHCVHRDCMFDGKWNFRRKMINKEISIIK